ncbi:MAG: hypothetical protein Ta2F_07670 [Termitinemataceae bacterium]|nr:MAG: hypothetical protein Ta2F_07670 [Termitinemataceae bacterium]
MDKILVDIKNLLSNLHLWIERWVVDFDSGEHQQAISFIFRLGLTAAIVVVQIILIKQTIRFAAFADSKMQKNIYKPNKSKLKKIPFFEKLEKSPLFEKFKPLNFLDKKHTVKAFSVVITIAKWLLIILQLFLTLPLILGLFEPTRGLASKIFGYILTPIKNFIFEFLNYIPNIFTIVIIIFIVRYFMKFLRFLSEQIKSEKIKLKGFFPEWAEPTFNILRVVIIAFTVALIYPYLPNAESDIFKGVSVLVGIIFSLGSSSVIGNVIAGLVMTYMRPFKIGDRIKINDITGFVVERSAMVTRIRTHKNEFVTLPNSMVLSTSVTNYNKSTMEEQSGLIVYICITMGYDVPWRTVHEVLKNAALKSENILKEPEPFINQIALNDFYCTYELNAYTKNVSILPRVYSEVYTNIQDGFAEKGISLYAPHFQVQKHVEDI